MNRTANPSSVPQVHELVENLALSDDIERGGRFVHDQELRLEGECHRDHDPLPHAAGQFVRVAAEPVRGDADHLEQFAGPGASGGPVQFWPVRLEHIGELDADRHHRVQRVHGALQDHGELVPAQLAKLGQVSVQQVDRVARRAGRSPRRR